VPSQIDAFLDATHALAGVLAGGDPGQDDGDATRELTTLIARQQEAFDDLRDAVAAGGVPESTLGSVRDVARNVVDTAEARRGEVRGQLDRLRAARTVAQRLRPKGDARFVSRRA